MTKPLAVWMVLASSLTLCAQVHHWDVALTAQAGQATTYMATVGGGFCGVPVEMGDYDNDGFPDYAVSPMLSASGPGQTRTEAGEVTVFKGSGAIGGIIDLQAPPPGQPLLRIYGAAAFDYVGTEMYSADVTGDGISDLILGAMGHDPLGRDRAGATYVFPGGAAHFNGATIDLASPPSWVIQIFGRNPLDRFGIWVEAGDINGDGVADILAGADGGDGISDTNPDRGEAVAIFGGQAFPSVIDLAAPPPGLAMTTVYGVDDGDHYGTTLYSADLDGDGYAEFVVAAAMNRAGAVNTGPAVTGGNGPANNENDAGEAQVLFGRAVWPTTIDLANPDPFTAGTRTVIYGADSGDVLAEEMTSGDLDGDGFQDLVLGALTANGFNNAFFWAGDIVVAYGGPTFRGLTLDMATLPVGTSTIHGEFSNDILADTLSTADVNADGYDDLFAASPHKTVVKPGIGAVPGAGAVDVLFGSPVRWPAQVTLGSLPRSMPWRRVMGADAGDLLAYSMEAGDFDLDGFGDIFPNAMRGDGINNTLTDAGEINIVSGRLFSRGLCTLGTLPTIGSTVTLEAVGEPNKGYVAAFSLGDGPAIPLGAAGTIELALDFVFYLSIDPANTFFTGTLGTLDAQGRGSFGIVVPPIPALAGLQVYGAFVTTDLGSVLTASNTVGFTLTP